MLDGVLHYSRVAGAGLTREPVDMAQVARDVEGNLGRAIADSGATLEIGPLPRVEGDRVQLTQLLQNLVANALKFSGDRPPRVEVSADEHPDGFSFTVRDHGIGVDPGDAERIFDMFVRAEGVAGSQSGSGIGLAVCRRIVERHGGTIGVEPTPGGGSTFRFSLPPLLRHPPLGGAPAVPVGAAG
jgi:signal transduction histidine kinase